MQDENTEDLDSLNEEETTDVAETYVDTDTSDEVDVKALKKQNKKLFERAKKAEGFEKDSDGNWVKKEKPAPKVEKPSKEGKGEAFDLFDIRALAKVHDEDVEKVQKFARSEGISVAEAMKSEDLQVILKHREEKRKTAEATSTSGGSKGLKTNMDKEILSKVDTMGEMSQSELERGAELMIEALKSQNK